MTSVTLDRLERELLRRLAEARDHLRGSHGGHLLHDLDFDSGLRTRCHQAQRLVPARRVHLEALGDLVREHRVVRVLLADLGEVQERVRVPRPLDATLAAVHRVAAVLWVRVQLI
eukprot:9491859-Pyramimonas_sp.AAC.1